MKDKVQKIREEVERVKTVHSSVSLKDSKPDILAVQVCINLLSFIDSLQEETISENLEVELNKYIKDHFTIDKEQLDRFGIEEKDYMYSMDKGDMLALVEHFTEPVSKNLEKASKEWLRPQLDKSYANYGETKMMELTHFDGYAMLDAIEFGAKWQKEKEYTCYEEAFEDGAKWKAENLWKPANGDNLPEIDREVVVFTQNFPNDVQMMSVAIAHRPNPNGWDGKSVTTGKVEHYTPKTYDKGGWNIPDVKYWLDVDLPNKED